MTHRLGFDIGGTFTDIFVYDTDSKAITQTKVLTTPEEFSRGAIEGISKTLGEDIRPEEIGHVVHGSTVATNALLEQNGAETGLLTTAGFRDVLAFGRQQRGELYDISASRNPVLVDRRNRLGVDERVDSDGEVVTPLDEESVVAAVETLAEHGVESVAVSLLHSYRNDDHERRIADLVERHLEVPVSVSSAVMPEIQEYERTLSTVIDAYVGPEVNDYIESLRTGLTGLDIDVPLYIMLASGGVVTPENLQGRYLKMINSGPAAGVIGAKRMAEVSGEEHLITLDMGGTSTDVSLVRDGRPETTTQGEIDDVPLLFEQVDVRSVGTGGGSIASTEQGAIIKVGPESAGSDPGPACYGGGGKRPTVTDAACVLNYLPDTLGGELELDEAAARAALARLGSAVGRDVTSLAEGIVDITITDMVQAIETVTVEKGYDPREFVLVCYGGAGPLFGSRIARELGIERAIVPVTPGVLSAVGLVTSNRRFDFTKSAPLLLDDSSVDEIRRVYKELEAKARSVGGISLSFKRNVDLSYHGQSFDINVELPAGDVTAETVTALEEDFHRRFDDIYGFSDESKPIQATTWRLTAIDPVEDPVFEPPTPGTDLADAVTGTKEAYVDGQFREHRVYDRSRLPVDVPFEGPAIVEEAESTTVVGPKSTVRRDDNGNLVITV